MGACAPFSQRIFPSNYVTLTNPLLPFEGPRYQVSVRNPANHLFQIELALAAPHPDQQFALPAWIPGSYLLREFAKHVQNLRATQGGCSVAVSQIDKHSWQVACSSGEPLVLEYEVYAADPSVRSALLDGSRAFFNGTSLFLRALGHEHLEHTVHLHKPASCPNWRAATALPAANIDAEGFGVYRGNGYDQLVDCPVELGSFWEGRFDAAHIAHRMVVSGAAPTFDGARLLADSRTICEAVVRFWHGNDVPPLSDYLFLLHVMDDGYGGLEHRHSTALIAARRDLPRQAGAGGASAKAWKPGDGYTTLLGLISHEYFHTWNVKRLRPAEFERYNYAAENYTELLWFFEGFTSYYDDLLLVRAGLLDTGAYLKLLGKTMNQVLQTPGRQVQTVAQASFDAWVKFYRQDDNTANATVSYYTKGALVALCLDLTLRSEGIGNLDQAMRQLWKQHGDGPVRESDVLAALQLVGARSFADELQRWVHSTEELPVAELLALHGVELNADTPQRAQQLGLRVAPGDGIRIKSVLRGGLAERAGMAAGDEWLGIEGDTGSWRLKNLDDLDLYLVPGETQATALVGRDQRLLRLTLPLSACPDGVVDTVRLRITDETRAQRWLHDGAAIPALKAPTASPAASL